MLFSNMVSKGSVQFQNSRKFIFICYIDVLQQHFLALFQFFGGYTNLWYDNFLEDQTGGHICPERSSTREKNV